jgi:ubiquinone/menaquinone biosynthesis C-methylase UbiE
MRTEERLVALMQHLQLRSAHFATQIAGDLAGLAAKEPQRIAGLVLCVPTRLDPSPFAAVATRVLMICGQAGLSADATGRAQARLAGAQRRVLANYQATGWSDVVADRAADVAGAMISFLTGDAARAAGDGPATMASVSLGHGHGSHAGITYRITGSGPPLMLLPFFLAPSQWEPALGALEAQFTVIRLGGPHIGGVAALEDRARAPSYRGLFSTLVDLLAPAATSRILDVGCGSGALDRSLAARLGPEARIDAIDVNPFLLREAAALAGETAARLRFTLASAVALPFADATFDCIFSVTVLEETDADRAIAEMVRVARTGARIGLVVRAIDMPQWWNLTLPPAIAGKAAIPPQSVGAGGVADASLYRRMRRAGLTELRAFPALVTLDEPEGPIWRYREDHVLSELSPEETAEWTAARATAQKDGLLLQAHALHCAVGRKPAA